MEKANFWIGKLNLKKHPEGGYYGEVYQSEEQIEKQALPERYRGSRSLATSIYFLLKGNEFSSFHRLQSDETWHFYEGATLELFVIGKDGALHRILLGRNPDAGETHQTTIGHNHWFAARVTDPAGYALVGCTVSPGFHFDDFELADRVELMAQYPQHGQLIKDLTFKK
jgi:uncharacterized protein